MGKDTFWNAGMKEFREENCMIIHLANPMIKISRVKLPNEELVRTVGIWGSASNPLIFPPQSNWNTL